jgi:hypothetical protein
MGKSGMPKIDTACKSLLLLLAAQLPVAALAQDELLDEEQAAIKLYTVEIVVFTYTEDVSVGSEIFPPEAIEVADDDPADIDLVTVRPLRRRHPDFIGLEPLVLGEDQYTMQKVVEQLELLDAYHPILHVAWTQPGYPPNDTVALPVPAFAAAPPDLDGSFTLYLSRYLHLVVDLALTAPASAAEYTDEYGAVREFEYALPPLDGPVRYRIQEDRIVKDGEIRYFDHPKFGVVAKVQRVEAVAGGSR